MGHIFLCLELFLGGHLHWLSLPLGVALGSPTDWKALPQLIGKVLMEKLTLRRLLRRDRVGSWRDQIMSFKLPIVFLSLCKHYFVKPHDFSGVQVS